MNEIDKNKSYTNKDFQAIYEELLDLVPKLTSKWNPNTSDDADPGKVLIKLMAVLGDKLNYNMDKNILENFPLTVTQRSNARQLYDLIGYKMGWYQSAFTDISFLINSDDITTQSIEIPQFTQLTDIDKELSYTTLSKIILNATQGGSDRYEIKTIRAIQGVVQDLLINDSNEILITDLDEYYRIYLPLTQIAENGIFISEANASDYNSWTQVDNIEAYPLGNKVYTFVAGSVLQPAYIQFPTDVANLLSNDRLNIKYTTTLGVQGNINANTIVNFANDITDSDNNIITSKVSITQAYPSILGKDPETIEEAYTNSRKIVGTFNTLVTRQDYQNYLQRYRFADGSALLANCVVADRTKDLNQTFKCLALESFKSKLNIKSNLSPYDIVVYGLEPSLEYDKQFNPITNPQNLSLIEAAVSEVKSINQDFHLPTKASEDSDIYYLYNNKYSLKGSIITSEKLTEEEALELETNILTLLQNYYSAYNVSFGSPIDYEELLQRIKDSDSRIKNIALDTPIYNVQKTVESSSSLSLNDLTSEDKVDIVARTISNGNLSLFNFDTDLTFDFGQSSGEIVSNVAEIALNTSLEITNNPTKIPSNELIQLIKPLTSVWKEYVIGCNITSTISILANTEVILKNDEKITITYVDANNVTQNDVYTSADNITIKSSVDLNKDESKILTSGQTLQLIKENSYELKSQSPYLLIKNSDLTLESNEEYILEIGEYFIYTNDSRTQLLILGSGTSLINNNATSITLTTVQTNLTDINAEDISSIDWNNTNNIIKIRENEIITIGPDNLISFSENANQTLSQWNVNLTDLESKKDWEILNADLLINNVIYSKSDYKIRLRFNLSLNNTTQSLEGNQKLYYKLYNSQNQEIIANKTISFNYPTLIVGDIWNNVDVDRDASTNPLDKTFTIYSYNASSQIKRNSQNLIEINNNTTLNFKFNFEENVYNPEYYFVPIEITGTSGILAITNKEGNNISAMSGVIIFTQPGNYILKIDSSMEDLNFTFTEPSDFTVFVGDIYSAISLNSAEIDYGDFNINVNKDEIIAKINYYRNKTNTIEFNWVANIAEVDKCVQPLDSSQFFNINHPLSDFTIPQLDISKYNIKVNPFSLRK